MEKGKKNLLFPWSPDSIRWYKTATEYCGYHRHLSDLLTWQLPKDARVCDMGCGIGSLALELAPHCSHVTAVDIDAIALESLRSECSARHIENIEITEGDFELLSPPEKPFDAIIFCLFGNLPHYYARARQWATGKIFFIVNASSNPKFSIADNARYRSDEKDCREFLDSVGAVYRQERVSLDFGQPLTDIEEALKFVRYYNPDASDKELKAHLEKYLRVAFGGYAFFLPSQKDLSIFSIDI